MNGCSSTFFFVCLSTTVTVAPQALMKLDLPAPVEPHKRKKSLGSLGSLGFFESLGDFETLRVIFQDNNSGGSMSASERERNMFLSYSYCRAMNS